jgi:hypothetical protein
MGAVCDRALKSYQGGLRLNPDAQLGGTLPSHREELCRARASLVGSLEGALILGP